MNKKSGELKLPAFILIEFEIIFRCSIQITETSTQIQFVD